MRQVDRVVDVERRRAVFVHHLVVEIPVGLPRLLHQLAHVSVGTVVVVVE